LETKSCPDLGYACCHVGIHMDTRSQNDKEDRQKMTKIYVVMQQNGWEDYPYSAHTNKADAEISCHQGHQAALANEDELYYWIKEMMLDG
jgi:hypothetical protein